MGKELNNILGTRSLVEWLGTWFVCTPATLNGKERKLIHPFIQNTFDEFLSCRGY